MNQYNKNAAYARRLPSITCIGGGTGLSAMLRGLKRLTPNITAIVTVADDGGGSGVLRDELGMPPPGDIRNCIQALSNMEPTMAKLLSYRFESGHLEGQSFGNLFLAAMNGISDSFDKAVARTGEVLAITGQVLPVSNEDIRLKAELENGAVVFGESKIYACTQENRCRIKKVSLVPEHPHALPASVDAILSADMLIIGPGSLYTSIIPNLLVDGIAEAISKSAAVKLYVCNVMTQPGETESYTASDHIRELFCHSERKLFDNCLVNNMTAPAMLLEKYAQKGAEPVKYDKYCIERMGIKLYESPVAEFSGKHVRHHSDNLAAEIMRIFRERSPTRLYRR